MSLNRNKRAVVVDMTRGRRARGRCWASWSRQRRHPDHEHPWRGAHASSASSTSRCAQYRARHHLHRRHGLRPGRPLRRSAGHRLPGPGLRRAALAERRARTGDEVRLTIPLIDVMTSELVCSGAMAALIARGRNGRGAAHRGLAARCPHPRDVQPDRRLPERGAS